VVQHIVFAAWSPKILLSYSRSQGNDLSNTDGGLGFHLPHQRSLVASALLAGWRPIKMASLTGVPGSHRTVGPADHSLELLRQTAVKA